MQQASLFETAESRYGLPQGYLARTAELESGMNQYAQNPNSSAGGPFQFLDDTAKQYGLTNKSDWSAATDAAARLARDNLAVLKKGLGRNPTADELYLAHQQGGQGALRLLTNPDASTDAVVGSAASRFNGGDGRTAGQFTAHWSNKFNGNGGAPAAPLGVPTMNAITEDPVMPPQTVGGLGGLGGMIVNSPDFGNFLSAIGHSLLSSPNTAPLQGVPAYLAQTSAQQHARAKDARDFAFRQSESQREQRNSDASMDLERQKAAEARLTPGAKLMRDLFPTLKPGTTEYLEQYKTVNGLKGSGWTPVTIKDNSGDERTVFQNKNGDFVLPEQLIPGFAAPSGGASAIPAAPAGSDQKAWRKVQTETLATNSGPAKLDDVTALRKEVRDLPSYKNVAQAAPVYNSMLDAAGRDTRAADVNLIYGMAKIMDPGSVVRESEMSVAQAIATLPQHLQSVVKSQLDATGRLSADVRAGIMEEAHSRMGSYRQMYDQDATQFRGIVQRRRMDEADVLPSFGEFKKYERPSAKGAGGAPAIGAVEQGYRFKGGNPGDPANWEKVQ